MAVLSVLVVRESNGNSVMGMVIISMVFLTLLFDEEHAFPSYFEFNIISFNLTLGRSILDLSLLFSFKTN